MKNVNLLFAIIAALVVGAHAARETPQAVSLDAQSTAEGIHVMELTQDFLAVAAHKLPYGNPNTGGCMTDEKKVSIQGIPGSFCSPECSPTQLPKISITFSPQNDPASKLNNSELFWGIGGRGNSPYPGV